MPKASVKVMNSYDYCHFEVVLGSDQEMSFDDVDEMRKQAQRLVDKSISQYKIAKERANQRANRKWEREQLLSECKRIEEKPEGERTAEDKAKLKALDDYAYWAEYNYDYEDE